MMDSVLGGGGVGGGEANMTYTLKQKNSQPLCHLYVHRSTQKAPVYL